MKLSYSTRGWHSLSFEDYANIAEEMKFAGYELYDLFKHEEYFAKGGPLDPYAVRSTMRNLRDRGHGRTQREHRQYGFLHSLCSFLCLTGCCQLEL